MNVWTKTNWCSVFHTSIPIYPNQSKILVPKSTYLSVPCSAGTACCQLRSVCVCVCVCEWVMSDFRILYHFTWLIIMGDVKIFVQNEIFSRPTDPTFEPCVTGTKQLFCHGLMLCRCVPIWYWLRTKLMDRIPHTQTNKLTNKPEGYVLQVCPHLGLAVNRTVVSCLYRT